MKKEFVLSLDVLRDFQRGAEKLISKPKLVSMQNDSFSFSLYIMQDGVQASFRTTPVDVEPFSFSIEASKFFQAIKNLYGDSASFSVGKQLKLVKDNIVLKFPLSENLHILPRTQYQVHEIPEGFVRGASACASIPQNDMRFYGVLLEPFDGFSLLSKFDGTSVCVAALDNMYGERQVISFDFAQMLKAPLDFNWLMFSERMHGVRLASQVELCSAYMEDTYPPAYLGSLGLQKARHLVDLGEKPSYVFNAEDLLQVLSMIVSIIGDEEGSLTFKHVGTEAQSGRIVWEVTATTFNGFTASEKITCEAQGNTTFHSFNLHIKQLVKSLRALMDKALVEKVFIVDEASSVLMVTDETSQRVILFSKVG